MAGCCLFYFILYDIIHNGVKNARISILYCAKLVKTKDEECGRKKTGGAPHGSYFNETIIRSWCSFWTSD